ncbi:transporter substrate-binding domain-containing protein [Palleronia sediminis]|nr:transporter substrate-binding domain-containing protein [Palleronia sediminis]
MTMLRKLSHAVTLATGITLAAGTAGAQGLIQEVLDRGTLRVGVAEGPPYQYPDAMSGDYVGLNIDLAKEVAEIMGVELEVVPATWATLVTGLEVEQYDVIFANLFATPQRALSVAFTDAYDTYGFHVMVRVDSDLQTLEDVNSEGVTFAGVAGTVEAQYPAELFPNATVTELVTDQANAGPTSVLSGQSDAVLVDPGFLRILTAQNPALAEQTRLLNGEDNLLKPVSLSYAVRHDDMDMLSFLNVFIRDKVANGVIATKRDRWFDTIAQQ